MNMIIKVVAGIVTFTLSTIFSSDHMILLSKSVTQSEIKNDKFRVIVMSACKTCNLILKDAEAQTLSCAENLLEDFTVHKVLKNSVSYKHQKFDEKHSLIVSDHKTHCEYINLFGKQIGGVPRA
jgi:hypothetical protein